MNTNAESAQSGSTPPPPAGCQHPDSLLVVAVRDGLSFVHCAECETSAWWAEGEGWTDKFSVVPPATR